ncbi:MAG: hypothetical protein FWF54_00730, partial [Candidatus Azobacteroides sp.]|nr:hypothetical protein [Candidatus Azobacteroides sp.]
MAKKIDLFTINILGLTETVNSLSTLESELKAVNSLVSRHTKTIREFEDAQKNGANITNKMADAYIEAKNALPGLTDSQKSLTRQIGITNAVIDKEIQEYRDAEREKIKAASAAKKQSDDEKKLQENLTRQVKSIEDLAVKTNALIKVRKSLDLTTVEGRTEFDALTKEIAKNREQLKEYDAQIGNFQRNVGNYSSAVSGLIPLWMKGAAAIATISKGIEYTIKIIGDKTEGVEQAFARLNNPNALNQLKEATKGTVSDLELMKAAVNADNFKIPLDVLARGLQFAQQRAKDTGQSVDYLVNSFVTGIGRKSVMILDNLGISAVAIKEKLGNIGTESATVGQMAEAVGKIIEEEMVKAGQSTDIASEKAGQLTAAWENLRNQSTKKLSNLLSPLAESARDALNWIARNTDALWVFIKVLGGITAAVYSYIAAAKLEEIWANRSLIWKKLTTVATMEEAKAKLAATVAEIASTQAKIAGTVAIRTSTSVLYDHTGAVIVNTAANRTATASTYLLAAAQLFLQGNIRAASLALKEFAVTLFATPVGWIMAGIMAVAGGIYIWSQATSTQEQAQNLLNKSMENAAKRKDDLSNETQKLVSVINDETRATVEQIEKYRELQGKFPEQLKNMDLAAFKTMSLTEQQKLLNKAINDADFASKDDELEQYQKALESLDKAMSSVKVYVGVLPIQKEIEKINELLGDSLGWVDKTFNTTESTRDVLYRHVEALKKQKEQREENQREAERQLLSEDEKREMLNRQLTYYEKQADEIRKTLPKTEDLNYILRDSSIYLKNNNEIWGKFDPQTWMNIQSLNIFNKKILEIKNLLNGGATGDSVDKNKEYWDKVASDAKKAIENIPVDKLNALKAGKSLVFAGQPNKEYEKNIGYERDYKKAKEDRAEAQKNLAAYEDPKKAGKGSGKSEERELTNAAQKRNELIKNNAKIIHDLVWKNNEDEIKIQAEGIEQKLKLQEQADKKEIEQLKDKLTEQQKLIDEAKKTKGIKPEELNELDSQREQLGVEAAYQEVMIQKKAYNEKKKLLDNYTIDEIKTYQERLTASENYNEADLQLTKEVIDKKQKLQDEKINENIAKEQQKLRINYESEKDIINATVSDRSEREKALADLHLANAQDRFALLKKEMELKRDAGNLTKQDSEKYKNGLKEIYDEIGVLADKQKRQTPLAKMLGMDDENVELLKEKAFQLASEIADTLFNIQAEGNRRRLENETKRIDDAKSAEESSLERRKQKGIISEEAYEKRKAQIDKEYERQKTEAQRQAFEKDKDIKRKQALMEMALGVARIWAQSGVNVVKASILSAALVATTMVKIAEINAQQFAGGGKVYEKLPNGKIRYNKNITTLSNGDDILATVKKGEVILNETQQKALGGDTTFRSIGVPGFAGGGKIDPSVWGPFYPVPTPDTPDKILARQAKQRMSDAEIIDYINKRTDEKLRKIKVYVTETDIERTGAAVKTSVTQAG